MLFCCIVYSYLTVTVGPELKDLLKELYRVSDKWYNIGILLGIDPRKLDIIKTTENNPHDCLREMLRIWLNEIFPPPSWAAIADAIEVLGEEILANQLRIKYRVL